MGEPEGQRGRFPGRIGPGLIEASPSWCRGRRRSSFPGRIGPGLIEAAADQLALLVAVADFPGELARASLKRQQRRPRPPMLGNFPGELARASLKLEDWYTNNGYYRTFPGRIGPGLIEAFRTA